MNPTAPQLHPSTALIPSSQSALLAALAELPLRTIGRQVLHYSELGSSNTVLLDLAAQGAAEGQVIVVDTQNAGRGRMGRRWISPPVEAGLMLSVLLRPEVIMPFACTMMAGVALCEAVEQLCALRVALKLSLIHIFIKDQRITVDIDLRPGCPRRDLDQTTIGGFATCLGN